MSLCFLTSLQSSGLAPLRPHLQKQPLHLTVVGLCAAFLSMALPSVAALIGICLGKINNTQTVVVPRYTEQHLRSTSQNYITPTLETVYRHPAPSYILVKIHNLYIYTHTPCEWSLLRSDRLKVLQNLSSPFADSVQCIRYTKFLKTDVNCISRKSVIQAMASYITESLFPLKNEELLVNFPSQVPIWRISWSHWTRQTLDI